MPITSGMFHPALGRVRIGQFHKMQLLRTQGQPGTGKAQIWTFNWLQAQHTRIKSQALCRVRHQHTDMVQAYYWVGVIHYWVFGA